MGGKSYAKRLPRLTTPMVRDNGRLRDATWDEALDRAADGFRAVLNRHGPDGFGMFSCSKPTDSPSQRSANLADEVRRGSMAYMRAPLARARRTWWKKIGWASRALDPHSKMTSARATSA